jgi:hypothetical protein
MQLSLLEPRKFMTLTERCKMIVPRLLQRNKEKMINKDSKNQLALDALLEQGNIAGGEGEETTTARRLFPSTSMMPRFLDSRHDTNGLDDSHSSPLTLGSYGRATSG